MAIADSNTIVRPEITGDQSVIAGTITALLKMPLGATHDLFQVLDICQLYTDELTETHNNAEYIALCERLLAGLTVLKVVLNAPLPKQLIEQLTVKESQTDEYRNPRLPDSQTACDYCSALTMVLLNQQVSQDQQEHIAELLSEMLAMLTEDLKTPRFIRTAKGLAMMDGEALQGIH